MEKIQFAESNVPDEFEKIQIFVGSSVNLLRKLRLILRTFCNVLHFDRVHIQEIISYLVYNFRKELFESFLFYNDVNF